MPDHHRISPRHSLFMSWVTGASRAAFVAFRKEIPLP